LILVFNGKNYESQTIINQSRQGFEALVSVGELDTSLAVPDVITKVAYEFAGKKYLLVGSIMPDAVNVKVRVITKHLLKKCEVIEEVQQAPRQYQPNGYNSYSQDRGFNGRRY
jgi:hypothetical protein